MKKVEFKWNKGQLDGISKLLFILPEQIIFMQIGLSSYFLLVRPPMQKLHASTLGALALVLESLAKGHVSMKI